MNTEVKAGDVLESHRCGKFEIINEEPNHCLKIRFLDTGYEAIRKRYSVYRGEVGDPYCRKIAGVGYKGEGKYKTRTSPPESKKTPQYACWENMLYRVYDLNHRLANRYSGRGVTVCEDWLNFQNFAAWFDENYIDGCVLDKDITSPGSLQYSPETCSFVPQEINKFFTAMNKRRGDFPVGVYKQGKAFIGSVMFRESTISKSFSSPEEAFLFYKEHKEKFLKEMTQEYYDNGSISRDIYVNLMQWEAVPYPE